MKTNENFQDLES